MALDPLRPLSKFRGFVNVGVPQATGHGACSKRVPSRRSSCKREFRLGTGAYFQGCRTQNACRVNGPYCVAKVIIKGFVDELLIGCVEL